MSTILKITVAAAASAMLAAMTAGPATAAGPARPAAACTPWDGVQPVIGSSAFLYGISVLPTCEAFAVGKANNPPRMLIENFSGSSWTRQGIPALPGTESQLSGVTALSATRAWAVGSEHPGGKRTQDLAIAFDGSFWAVQTLPPLAHDATAGSLTGVSASSGRDVWAVGSYQMGKVRQTQILHGDGQFWKTVASPDPGGPGHSNVLTSVAVVSRDDAWAAGYYRGGKFAGPRALILHWDGKTWTQVASPTPTPAHQGMLFGITATSASNAWAVGYTTKPVDSTLVLHWNGSAWSQQRSPNPPPVGDEFNEHKLYAVSATSARNAWAAGEFNQTGDRATLILHWDGHAWKWTSGPGEDGNQILYGVAAGAPTGGAWVVGFDNNVDRAGDAAFTLRWNGTTWQR